MTPSDAKMPSNQSQDSTTSSSSSDDDDDMSMCDSMGSPEIEFTTDDAMMVSQSTIIFCESTLGRDIYKHLREAETKKRPCTRYMETVQKNINAAMRAITIDWLIEVADYYKLAPEVSYLTANYMDRYLSGNNIDRNRLQLLGAASMLIASKHEGRSDAFMAEDMCYLTENGYTKEEMLWMEADVLRYLKFEMTVPTAKCFLRIFVPFTQGCYEVSMSPLLGFLADYIAELSLLDYNMIRYTPSMIAAASVFLANYMLQPNKDPWNTKLRCYTLYQPSDLQGCVKDLQRLLCNSSSNLPRNCYLLLPEDLFN